MIVSMSVEQNVSWRDTIEKALSWMSVHTGMWPSVAFRLLAVASDDDPPSVTLRTLAGHFQGSPTPQASRSKVRLQSPFMIEGVLTHDEFVALLKHWLEGEHGQIGHWVLPAPAGLANFWCQMDVPISPANFPLIDELPAFRTVYREARLSGSGEQIDQQTRAAIQDRLFDIDATRAQPALFARDYLGVPWGMDATYMLIHFPLALGMTASYDLETELLNIEAHFRSPLTASDLQVRVGSGLYDASLEPLPLEPMGSDSNGWNLAKAQAAMAPGGAAKVWLSRVDMLADFGWELTVDLGRSATPELKRERFIAEWYRLGRKEFSQEVEVRVPGGSKGDRPGDAFELALANACGAIGLGVMFAGHLLQSAGVDFVAFDASTHRAYVISATTGNDIEEKLRTWLSVAPLVANGLAPEWSIRPVIITSQPSETLIGESLRSCYLRGVLVLASEQLAPLKEAPPDLEMFGRLLAQDAPDLTTPRSPFA